MFEARPGTLAEGIGGRWRRPVPVAAAVTIVGYVVLSVLIVGIGLLLTHLLLSGAVGRWDEHVNEWFVRQRTAGLDRVTSFGTTVGSTGTVVGVAAVVIAILAFKRRWREAAFIFIAMVLEVTVFLTTTLLVNRPRPTVVRLDPSPPTSSFPSGHTAAAIALWWSLAIVILAHVRNTLVRILVWTLALVIPVFVAVSRLYRGMHHPTDVMGSVVVGVGALLISLLAVRAASEAASRRNAARVDQIAISAAPVEVAP